MAARSLESAYQAYIAALNERPFRSLADHMHPVVILNGNPMPREDFEALVAEDVDAAPDLKFTVVMPVVDESTQRVGSRIEFRCTPQREFMGKNIQGTVKCMEHMFYEFRDGKIEKVWWMPGELVAVEAGDADA
ncbi:uncharacterized protein UV8b_06055 [Ustilaginoidea virens]|uniref:Uncharacterized protein n=1 Tax=Ustilaginoidea virens TaxID=1159556 RepID=A0A063BZ78_USTVR|nr:uncharacterized protein UV8b_06055 [Ustilaginoidea virens]QUC21814.1 hypothetical protein UV8b_06055 [Ustilaginoidea virens]GAO17620.1 hypothetical protein UVI_02051030 [Ustilaginoidea virens]